MRSRQDAIEFLRTPVREIMTRYVVTTKQEMTVVSAATRMIAQDISCLIVADEERPIGIVTERDFLRKVPATPTALKLRVKDIMTKKVVTVSPDATVEKAEALMRSNNFRKLVVIDGDGKLLGVVTQTDISKLAKKRLRYQRAERVKDWMTKRVVSATPSSSFAAAKKLMVRHDVGAMPIKKGDAYVGIFTEYDVVAQFYDAGGILSIKSPKEILTAHIRSIGVDASIHFANRVMLEKKVRRLLVLDGRKVVGIITQTDIVHGIVKTAKEAAKEVPKVCDKIDRRSEIVSEFVTDNLKLYHV